MSRAEAERAARARLGDLDAIEQRLRAHDHQRIRRGNLVRRLDLVTADLRIALRSLARSPAMAITTTAILAVGIGMAVAMATVVRTVIVQHLPIHEQQRVVVLRAFARGELLLPTEDRKAFRRTTQTLSDVAGIGELQIASPNLIEGATYTLRR
jgi:hypothetical protein